TTSGPRRDPRHSLIYLAWRALAMIVGVLAAVAVGFYRLRSGHDLSLAGWLLLYLATTAFVWGFAGLFVRRLALGVGSTLLFGAAAFGVLALLGFLLAQVAAP